MNVDRQRQVLDLVTAKMSPACHVRVVRQTEGGILRYRVHVELRFGLGFDVYDDTPVEMIEVMAREAAKSLRGVADGVAREELR